MRLVAMATTELGHADRQVAVALDPLLEDQDVRRAVHRLERHQVGLAREHRAIILARRDLVGHDGTYSRGTCPNGPTVPIAAHPSAAAS